MQVGNPPPLLLFVYLPKSKALHRPFPWRCATAEEFAFGLHTLQVSLPMILQWSLDLDEHSNFIVWTRAVANKHYLVALTAIMLLLTMSFQPLASALLVVRDIWWTEPRTCDMITGLHALNIR